MIIAAIGSTGHLDYLLESIIAREVTQVDAIAPGHEGEDISLLIRQLEAYGIRPVVYESAEALLAKVRPDVAHIACRFDLHAHHAIAAMQSGATVFCEKIAALCLEDLALLEKTQKDTGMRYASMLALRYAPAFLAAKAAIKSGVIGEVRLVQTQKSYKLGNRPEAYRHRETYGGTIPWVGAHAIDWIWWLSGKRFKNVSALQSRADNGGQGELESTAIIQFRLEDDALATASLDYLRPADAPTHDDDRARVVGTKGIVEVRGRKAFLVGPQGEEPLPLPPARRIFTDFLKDECLVSAHDSFYVARVALIAQAAADKGRTLLVED